MALRITLFLLPAIHAASNITCPILDCEVQERLTPGVCFEHDNNVPTKKLLGAQCPSTSKRPMYCPFEIASNEYAWIEEYLQGQDIKDVNTMDNKETSQIQRRKMQAQCKDGASIKNDLNPGRDCSSDNQCKSMVCDGIQCQGHTLNTYCNDHADCHSGLFCEAKTVWPFQSQCSEYYKEDDVCLTDYQCSNSQICWYKTQEDRALDTKRCMKIYSGVENTKFGWYSLDSLNPSEDDFKINGRYCKSGLAYQSANQTASCAKTSGIYFQKAKLNEPFKCSPQNPEDKCMIKFDIPSIDANFTSNGSRGTIHTNCSCALTDQLSGFCSNVLGTDTYFKYTGEIQKMLERSNCHTLDRSDIRAQQDSCGLGQSTEWQLAVDLQFNVTHWPYIQSSANYHCVQKFFADSFTNLLVSGSNNLVALTSGLIVTLLLITSV